MHHTPIGTIYCQQPKAMPALDLIAVVGIKALYQPLIPQLEEQGLEFGAL
jgi:hypothetical protein